MKEAKSEAEQIISAYRAEMEAMYQKSLATVSPHIHTLTPNLSYGFQYTLLNDVNDVCAA